MTHDVEVVRDSRQPAPPPPETLCSWFSRMEAAKAQVLREWQQERDRQFAPILQSSFVNMHVDEIRIQCYRDWDNSGLQTQDHKTVVAYGAHIHANQIGACWRIHVDVAAMPVAHWRKARKYNIFCSVHYEDVILRMQWTRRTDYAAEAFGNWRRITLFSENGHVEILDL